MEDARAKKRMPKKEIRDNLISGLDEVESGYTMVGRDYPPQAGDKVLIITSENGAVMGTVTKQDINGTTIEYAHRPNGGAANKIHVTCSTQFVRVWRKKARPN